MFRTYEPQRDRLVAVKVFRLDITPEQAQSLATDLARVIEVCGAHPALVAPIAAGVEGTVAYLAEEYVAAESLDVALRHYAPAPLEKARPFLSQLSAAFDLMREAGVLHGALHPRDVFVTPDLARASGFGVTAALERVGVRPPVRRPYSAPERVAGRAWDSRADVYSLAAIAYELLTGKRIPGSNALPAFTLQDADGDRAKAIRVVLERALAEAPASRYETSGGFVEAFERAADEDVESHKPRASVLGAPLEAARAAQDEPVAAESTMSDDTPAVAADVVEETQSAAEPAMPPKAKRGGRTRKVAPAAPDDARDVRAAAEPEPLQPETDSRAGVPAVDEPAPESWLVSVDDLAVGAEASSMAEADIDFGADAVEVEAQASSTFQPEPIDTSSGAPSAWVGEAGSEPGVERGSRGIGAVRSFGAMLILSAGLAIGFAAGYLVRGPSADRAETAQGTTGQDFSVPRGAEPPAPTAGTRPAETDRPLTPAGPTDRGAASGTDRPTAVMGGAPRPAPTRSTATPPSAARQGRLLVRSTPEGAEVQVNGERRGATPLALRDLAYGTYQVRVSSDGYAPESRRITLSADEPSSSLALTLRVAAPDPAAAPAAERTPVGSLYVDSRPRGARIIVDDRLVGTTPALLSSLKPGAHEVRLERDGYRAWAVTVQVQGQEQGRVAASLEPLP